MTQSSFENVFVPSDRVILDALRKSGSQNVLQLAESLGVTATAIRQRLVRLLGQGMIDRVEEKAARGRPSHVYSITEKGRRQSGANFGDLAIVLWEEIRQIKDAEVRRGLLERLSDRLASMYAPQVDGQTTEERMREVAQLFAERNIPVSVEHRENLPVLTVEACPYPQLAERDRGICALEKMMFTELLGKNVSLTDCRLDGAGSCRFEAT